KNRDYAFEPGETEGGHDTSFPSGHTAGAVAVAAIVARDRPPFALPASATAALMSGIQIPRARHYPVDVAAGAALGLAAARLVDLFLPPNPLSQENPMSDAASKTVTAVFQTREAADYAIEHLVQQHGVDRTDIFAQAEGDRNTAGTRPSGGDAGKDDAPSDAALQGAIKVSADVASDKADLVGDAFAEMGGQDIATR
ncbi:phosphatase PAP2 family protein, partial [uncultured Paracoccus sp.]|uniref:phosphatase PAP2 family protein n=1 Tax=uncultured Paracoccus sp. TaxID=189685 RepID=UPI0025DA3AD9